MDSLLRIQYHYDNSTNKKTVAIYLGESQPIVSNIRINKETKVKFVTKK